jgi:soluble lytic murein transglycosylase-like protein
MTSGNMQINSRWPPVLQQHGISEQTLLDPCTNTYVGAWILARHIDLLSYGWLAAGAYNAGSQPSAWPTPEKLQRFSNGSPARDAPGHDGRGQRMAGQPDHKRKHLDRSSDSNR